jgi:hypothetical protein
MAHHLRGRSGPATSPPCRKSVLPGTRPGASCRALERQEKFGRPGVLSGERERTLTRGAAAARCGFLQTARFGKRLANEWRRIETWNAWEPHGAEWLPARGGAAKRNAARSRRKSRKPLLDKQCRSRQRQSQQHLMSYIRHIYCGERLDAAQPFMMKCADEFEPGQHHESERTSGRRRRCIRGRSGCVAHFQSPVSANQRADNAESRKRRMEARRDHSQ